MIAKSTIKGNEAILNLSKKSVREAKSMKVITIMALIYIPASFAAVSIISSHSKQILANSSSFSKCSFRLMISNPP